MAIRFTPEYNEYINKIVLNYNKRVTRANKLGKINKASLPEKVSVKTLKKSYTNRRDLDRELENLAMFKRKDARRTVDGSVSQYDLDVINKNRKATIKYFEKQAEYAKMRAKNNYPLQKERLNTIQDNLEILYKGTKNATEDDLRAMGRYVDKYRKSFERQATGYRGFLGEMDEIMKHLDFPKSKRDELFEKLSQLNEAEFYDLYERSDLIQKLYETADSPKYTGGKLVMHSTDREARKNVEALMSQIDKLIKETKARFA